MAEGNNKRHITVFIASPGDLAAERKEFRDAIHQLNAGFADGANVNFEALGWEDTLASTGRRSQSVINTEIDRCDVFILVMHRRWGQKAPDAEPYSSYTEEEFHRALECWRKHNRPAIFVFFKRVDAAQEADAGPQLQRVLDFRRQLEETRQVMYRYITDDDQSFLNEVDKHLRAYAKGELSSVDTTKDIVVLPLLAIKEVEEAKKEAKRHAKLADLATKKAEAAQSKIEELKLESAKEAANFAKEGSLELARQKFVRLIADTSNIHVLYLAYEFFERTGDLNSARGALERWLVLSGPDTKSSDTATAYGKLGVLYQTRGDLDRAESMYEKSLGLDEALDHKKSMAIQFGNLGNQYKTRGALDRAESMYKKSLELDEAIDYIKNTAIQFGNLGDLYQTRGDPDRAESLYEKAMELFEDIGSPNSEIISQWLLNPRKKLSKENDRKTT